jgi:PAS domain S-box-containing protein
MKKKDPQAIIIQQFSEDLEALESYTRDLWQFLPLPICYINPYQVILDTNLALEDFFGWESLELVGEKVEKLFVYKSRAQEIYQRVLKEKRVVNEEGEVLRKDGQKRIVNISASIRENHESHMIGFYFAFSDIGELKKLQTELEKKVEERTEELQERNEELEKFHKFTVGRELKIIELKEEIERLKKELT